MGKRLSAEEAAALGYKPKRLSAEEAAKIGYGRDEESEPAKPADDSPSVLAPESPVGAALQGGVQGLTFKLGDEILGGVETVDEAGGRLRQAIGLKAPTVTEGTNAINQSPATITKSWGKPSPSNAPFIPAEEGEQPSLGDVYRKARDEYRSENKRAEVAHPYIHGAAELAGNLAVPLPAVKAATTAGRIAAYGLQGAGVGSVLAAGGSEADLTQGENAGAALTDTAKGTAYGAAGGVAGGALASGFGKLGTYFGNKAAAQDAAGAAAKLADENASTLGAMRQKTGEAYRTLEKLKADAVNPNISQNAQQDAAYFLESPEGQALAESVAKNTLEQAPTQFGELAAKREAFTNAPETAAKEWADYMSKNTITADVLPRVGRYVQRGAGPAVGGVLGGPLGVVAGGVAGATVGAPGTAISNLVQKTPRFAIQSNRLAGKIASGSGDILGKLGAYEGEEEADKVFPRVREQPIEPGTIEMGDDNESHEKSKLSQYFGN